MPDTNQNSSPIIPDSQDAATEAQLERDIQAHAIGASPADDEIRLQSVRPAVTGQQPAAPPADQTPAESPLTNEIRLQAVRDAAVPPPAPQPDNPVQNPAAPSSPADNTTVEPQPPPTDFNPATIDDSGALPLDPENSLSLPTTAAGTNSSNSSASGSVTAQPPPVSGEDFSPAVAAQTQSLQDGGDRMRAALEQNSLITNSLFNRTLEMLDLQSRKLGDIDRRINEIHGQMRSLKNP